MRTYITEAYALKYYGECMNYRKQQSRVEIWQKGSVDSTYPRKIGDITGLSLAINGNEDIDAPIVKTILNLSMADTWDEPQIAAANATKHGSWEEFYTPDSTAYLVKLFTKEDGDTNWEHRWSGYITPDNWQETIGYRGQVGIVARDNLGHLQDFDFDLQGDSDGLVSAYDIIDGAFAKIAFPMTVDIGDEEQGARALLLEADAASGSHGLFDACLSVDNFKGGSWEKAFKDVLDSLGLTIRFVDGNTVAVTFIRNLPLCGNLSTPIPQTIEFYGAGTRMLVPAYKDVKIQTDFDYKQDVTFPGKVPGAYGSSESFHWRYWDERRQQTITGDALRTDAAQTGRGWFSLAKAFVNPASYFITGRGGGGAVVDTETTALLIANATDTEVQQAEAGYAFGKVNTPAAIVSLNVTASFTLSGRYLLRSGVLLSYEWTAAYVKGADAYWWNGSQWKNTQPVWTETTDNRIDFSAPMNLRDMPEGGVLTIFVRNIKASTGFCIGVDGVKMECNDPSTSLKSDLVTVVNNSAYNVRAKRTPAYGFLSKEVVWNVIGNYPNVFWKIGTGGSIKPFPYQSVWSDGTENLAVPVQWAKQTLMFHHSTLQQIEGEVGVIQNGMWRFDRPTYYKGHNFLQQGGTWDLLTGHVYGISLREYIDYATLWAGAATVAPTTAAFPQAGGSASFLITCADDKEWDVTGLPDWLTASVEHGTGSGSVTLFAGVNDFGSRTRTIYIAGVPVYVSQAQRDFDLLATPASIEKVADGGSVYLTIEASNDMAWKIALSDPEWLLVNGSYEWEGVGYNDAVLIYVQANETGLARTGAIYLYDGEDNLIQTIPVSQSAEGGGGEDLTLTITTNVDNPTIGLTIDGVATTYQAGMPVASGATVAVTIAKPGYSTQTDTFTMSTATTSRYYQLSESADATINPVGASISQSAQNVVYNISDPSNHGWVLDFDGPDSYSRIAGAGVTSGSATVDGATIRGTGNAVVYLSVPANPNAYTRTIDNSPFYFQDSTTGTRTSLWISQLGTQDTPTPVTSIALNKNTLTLAAGSSEKLTATVSPSGATNKNLAWTSSNDAVAQVGQDGTVYAQAGGTCTIRASATDGSGKYATCTVTVTGSSVAVQGVSLNKSSLTLGIGSTAQLVPTIVPSNATDKTVTWRSTASTVATVDSNGLVTGVGKGACRVYVKTHDGDYEAYCSINVTADGTMTVDDVNAKSIATTTSTAIRAANMQPSTYAVSYSAAWITGATVDRNSNPNRVRLQIQPNTGSSARSTEVTVTGKDLGGKTVTATFVLTQNGRTSGDVPCLDMTLQGPDTIYNNDNAADYSIVFDPATTTQNKVTWSVTDRSGNATTLAEIGDTYDSRCQVIVKPGASSALLRVKAVNYYNGSLIETKDITATYKAPTTGGRIDVSESYIEVSAGATQDNWAQVTLVDMQTPLSQLQVSKSGFITSAAVDAAGRVVIVFPANTSSESRSGSVTLAGTNNDGQPVTAAITYLQQGVAGSSYGFEVAALEVTGTTQAKIGVFFNNETSDDVTVRNLSYSIVGYNSLGSVTVRANGSLSDRLISAFSSEEEIYTIPIEVTGPTVRYVVTLTSSNAAPSSYEGDGTDPV